MSKLPKSPFPPGLAFFLDLPLRRLLIDREKFLRGMGVKEGDFVLEAGCGPGFFTETLSLIVGEKGKVYAQDVEEAMLRKVKKKIPSFRYPNVIPLLCNSSSLELPDSSCDVVFCANVIEEIYKEGELEGTVTEIDRVLKRGGTRAEAVPCPKNDPIVEELEEFARAVRGQAQPEADGERATASLAVILAGIRSAREGRTIEVREVLQ